MRFIRKWSLDIMTGAIASLSFAAKITGIELGIPIYLILGMVVFLIYGFDRMADSILLQDKERKWEVRSFFKYRKIFLVNFGIPGAITLFSAIYFLPRELLIFGLILSLCMMVYFIFLFIPVLKKTAIFYKEVWVGIIYTSCIWGIPASLSSWPDYIVFTPLILAFFFLVLNNVFIFSFFESDFKKYRIHVLLSILFSFLILIFTIFSNNYSLEVYIILGSMAILLSCILVFKGKLKKNHHYGILADAVFLLPGLIWLIS